MYSIYNYVINLNNGKKLSLRLLYNLFKKLGVLRENLNSII